MESRKSRTSVEPTRDTNGELFQSQELLPPTLVCPSLLWLQISKEFMGTFYQCISNIYAFSGVEAVDSFVAHETSIRHHPF
jgi:hypothetical protein